MSDKSFRIKKNRDNIIKLLASIIKLLNSYNINRALDILSKSKNIFNKTIKMN